ncbi:MAG: hypothetical protein HOV81_26125 [Kofleriaceae bacterium]|nr:hypothetical protein [Kofleriaceae bacterium]
MKGDIAFVGFVLTAEEWRDLDAESRAALCAVATRTHDDWLPQRLARSSDAPPVSEPAAFAEGSGPLEVTEYVDLDLND